MNKLTPKHIVYLVMLLAIVIFRYYQASESNNSVENDKVENVHPLPDNGDALTAMQNKRLKYSRHAECRMNCRYISEAEVKDALATGRINYKKSDLDNDRCPRYAVEDNTPDGQTVRIIFANCDDEVVVVTAIDLSGYHKCDCK